MAYEVRSVSHTGITVSDLDEAVGFWTEVLGFEFLGSGEVGGTLVENTTGVPGAHVRVAMVSKGRKTMRPRPCDVGSVHVALEVDDIEAVAEACAGYGWDMPGRIENLFRRVFGRHQVGVPV